MIAHRLTSRFVSALASDAKCVLALDFNDNWGGVVYDKSLAKKHGARVGAVQANGIEDIALDFDGINDCVILTQGTSPISVAVNNISMVCWVNWTGTTAQNYQVFFYNGASGSNGWGVLLTKAESDNIEVLCGGVDFADSNTSFTAGKWQHLATVCDAGTWKIYLDGVGLTVTGNPTPKTPTTGTWVGTADAVPTYPFNGIVDSVMVLERALSAREVHDLYMSCAR